MDFASPACYHRDDVKGAEKTKALKDLQALSGVGKSIARDLYDLGFRSPGEFKGRDPEILYRKLCELRGTKVDRCMLYVFRCVVYAVSAPCPDPDKLKWWRWKDGHNP